MKIKVMSKDSLTQNDSDKNLIKYKKIIQL